MPSPRRRAAPGFSLIELMVGLALAAIVITAAASVMVMATKSELEARKRAQMNRDLIIAAEALAYDLGFAGTGIPYGGELNPDGSPIDDDGDPNTPLVVSVVNSPRPIVRVGEAEALAFVGDLPLPNATLNGLAGVSFVGEDDRGEGDNVAPAPGVVALNDALSITSEISFCGPETAAAATYNCNTLASNLLGITSGDCTVGALPGAETCPWGLNKWQLDGSGEMHILVSSLAGGYFVRRWNGDFVDDGPSERIMMHLSHNFPGPGEHVVPNLAFFIPGSGGGFISTPDRVFWRLVTDDAAPTFPCPAARKALGQCKLQRRQCWGPPYDRASKANFEWPTIGTAATAAPFSTPKNCEAGTNGTDWEDVVDGVSNFTLDYFHDDSAAFAKPLSVADSSRTQAVEFTLTLLRRPLAGAAGAVNITDTITRRVYMPHPGGIIEPLGAQDLTPAQGGCCDTTEGCAINMCTP